MNEEETPIPIQSGEGEYNFNDLKCKDYSGVANFTSYAPTDADAEAAAAAASAAKPSAGLDPAVLSQPLAQRLGNKDWRVRKQAAETIAAAPSEMPEPDVLGLLSKMAGEAQPAAQEAALDALVKVLSAASPENGGSGDVSKESREGINLPVLLKALITKCLCGRPKPKAQSLTLLELLVQMEEQKVVAEKLAEDGFKNKIPKVVAGAVYAAREILGKFGPSQFDVTEIVGIADSILTHRDKNVRKEGQELMIEICRWVGNKSMAPYVSKLKPAQQKELEGPLAKIEAPEKTSPEKKFWSTIKAGKANKAGGSKSGGGGEKQNGLTELLAKGKPVQLKKISIQKLLSAQFYTDLSEGKWNEKCNALASVIDPVKRNPCLDPADNYNELFTALKIAIGDVNINVRTKTVELVGLLAQSLGNDFAGHSKTVFPMILNSLKEKKAQYVAAAQATLDQIVSYSVPFLQFLEDVTTASKAKNPAMVLETLKFFDAALVKFGQRDAKIIDKSLKQIFAILSKTNGHESPDVRKCCHDCIRDLANIVGVPKVKSAPFLSSLDPKRLEALFKDCGKQTTQAEPSQQQQQQSSKQSIPPQQKAQPSTVSSIKTKKQATIPVKTVKSKGTNAAATAAVTVAKKKPRKPTYDELIATEAELCNSDDAELHFKELFSEKTFENISSRSFKARQDGYDEILRAINAPGFGGAGDNGKLALSTWSVLMEICERQESNVQGSLKIIDIIKTFAERAAEFKFGRACIAYVMRTFVVSKLGEPKQCAQAEACLDKFAQATSYAFVVHNLFMSLEGQRNTRCFAGALSWVATSLDAFGPDGINLEELTAKIVHNIGSNVLATSQKAMKAILVLLRLFGSEKVMAAIEACEEKLDPRKMEHVKAEAEKIGSAGDSEGGKEYIVTKDFEKYHAAMKAYNESIAPQPAKPAPVIQQPQQFQQTDMIVEPEIVSNTVPQQQQNVTGTPSANNVKRLMQTAESNTDWEARQRAIGGIAQAVHSSGTLAPSLCGNIQFLTLFRDKLLRDPNKNIVISSLECLEAVFTTLSSSLSSGAAGVSLSAQQNADKAGKQLLPAIFPLLGDSLKQKRECAVRCVAAIGASFSSRSTILPLIATFAASEKESTPTSRREALALLASQASLAARDLKSDPTVASAAVAAVRTIQPLFTPRQSVDIKRGVENAFERLCEACGNDFAALERAIERNEEMRALLVRLRARQRCSTRQERSRVPINQSPIALETPQGRQQLRDELKALAESGTCGLTSKHAAGMLSGDAAKIAVTLGEVRTLVARGDSFAVESCDVLIRWLACVAVNIGGLAPSSAEDIAASVLDVLERELGVMKDRGIRLLDFETRAAVMVLIRLRARNECVMRDVCTLFPGTATIGLVQKELMVLSDTADCAEAIALIALTLRCYKPEQVDIVELSSVILMVSHYYASSADHSLKRAALDTLLLLRSHFGDMIWSYVPSSMAPSIRKALDSKDSSNENGDDGDSATKATRVQETMEVEKERDESVESPQKKMRLNSGVSVGVSGESGDVAVVAGGKPALTVNSGVFTEEKFESIAGSIQKYIKASNIEGVLAELVELQRVLDCQPSTTDVKVKANMLFRVVGSLTKIAIRKDNEKTILEEYTLGTVTRLYNCTRAGLFDLSCLTQDSINQIVVALVRGYSMHKLFHKFILVLFRGLEPQKILSALFKELTYRINEKNYELIARNSMVDLIKEATQMLIKDPRNLFRASIDRLVFDLRQVIFLTKGNSSLVVIFKLAVGILNLFYVNEPEYMSETADRIETGHTKILTSYIQIFKESSNNANNSNNTSNDNIVATASPNVISEGNNGNSSSGSSMSIEDSGIMNVKRDEVKVKSPVKRSTPKTPKKSQMITTSTTSPVPFVPALARLTPKSASKTAGQYGDSLSEVGRLRERLQNIGNARSFGIPPPSSSSSSSSSSSMTTGVTTTSSSSTSSFSMSSVSSIGYKTPSQELKERVNNIISVNKSIVHEHSQSPPPSSSSSSQNTQSYDQTSY